MLMCLPTSKSVSESHALKLKCTNCFVQNLWPWAKLTASGLMLLCSPCASKPVPDPHPAALQWYDTFSWTMLMSTILYCVWFAIA